MEHFDVAAGILLDGGGKVLISQRLGDGPLNGFWEFPGGKLAEGERAIDALRRELVEELGINITEARPYMTLHHEYPDRVVDLEFFLVTGWHGEPAGLDGQALRWVHPAELDRAVLLPADAPVVDKLRACHSF